MYTHNKIWTANQAGARSPHVRLAPFPARHRVADRPALNANAVPQAVAVTVEVRGPTDNRNLRNPYSGSKAQHSGILVFL